MRCRILRVIDYNRNLTLTNDKKIFNIWDLKYTIVSTVFNQSILCMGRVKKHKKRVNDSTIRHFPKFDWKSVKIDI